MRVRLHGEVQDVRYEARHGHAFYQGDIDLGPITHDRANAIKGMDGRWPHGIVHWVFDGTASADQQKIRDAIHEYNLRTPLQFIEGKDPSLPYIAFKVSDEDDGSSFTTGIGPDGTDGGDETNVNIAPGGNSDKLTVLHELGHALGLSHEQSRADRNSTVSFDPDCTDHDDQFDTYSTSDYEALTNYDIASMMQYQSTGFCTPDPFGFGVGGTGCLCFPIVKRNADGTANHFSTVGEIFRPSDMSVRDVRALSEMYEPQLGSKEANDKVGAALAVGDFDGDGFRDLAVGAPGEAVGATAHTGAVFMYRGTADGLVAWKTIGELDLAPTSGAGGDDFGFTLAAGDFDNDGTSDLVIGAPGARAPSGTAHGGVAWVMYGGLGGPAVSGAKAIDQTTFTGSVSQAGDRFGETIAVADLDGDGRDDLAIAATHEVVDGRQQGYVNTLLASHTARTFTNLQGLKLPSTPSSTAQFGSAIAVADFDDDGTLDLAVSALGRGVYIYTGTGTGWSFATSVASTASPGGTQYGKALAVGNFDGTTYSTHASHHLKKELVVSAANEGAATNTGRMYFYHPALSGTTLTFSLMDVFGQGVITGDDNAAGDLAGTSMAARDLDGDGKADLVVGVPGKAGGGALLVYKGSASGFTSGAINHWMLMPNTFGNDNVEFVAPQASDNFGASVAIGDFNGDGTLDLVGGIPNRNSSAGAFIQMSGASPVFLGTRYIDETTSSFR